MNWNWLLTHNFIFQMHHQRYLQAVQLVQARFWLTKFITFHSLSLLLYAGVIRISKLLMHKKQVMDILYCLSLLIWDIKMQNWIFQFLLQRNYWNYFRVNMISFMNVFHQFIVALLVANHSLWILHYLLDNKILKTLQNKTNEETNILFQKR